MKETDWIWMAVIGVIYIAIVYGLVKPGSPAATGITAVAGALASLVATATGNSSGSQTGSQTV